MNMQRPGQRPFSIATSPAPDSRHQPINIPQKLFHGKPLQSSWKVHAVLGISLGKQWVKLSFVLMARSFWKTHFSDYN